jgi:hypothetical protein
VPAAAVTLEFDKCSESDAYELSQLSERISESDALFCGPTSDDHMMRYSTVRRSLEDSALSAFLYAQRGAASASS